MVMPRQLLSMADGRPRILRLFVADGAARFWKDGRPNEVYFGVNPSCSLIVDPVLGGDSVSVRIPLTVQAERIAGASLLCRGSADLGRSMRLQALVYGRPDVCLGKSSPLNRSGTDKCLVKA